MTVPFRYDAWAFSLAISPVDSPETVYKNISTAMLKSFITTSNNCAEPCAVSIQAYFYLLYSPSYIAIVPDVCIGAVDDYLKAKFSSKNEALVSAALCHENIAQIENQDVRRFIEILSEEQESIAKAKLYTGILINHTTHQFVSLKDTDSQLDCLIMLAMCFDPDMLETQSIIATNATVGEWAFDLLEVADVIPSGYTEFKPSFSLQEK